MTFQTFFLILYWVVISWNGFFFSLPSGFCCCFLFVCFCLCVCVCVCVSVSVCVCVRSLSLSLSRLLHYPRKIKFIHSFILSLSPPPPTFLFFFWGGGGGLSFWSFFSFFHHFSLSQLFYFIKDTNIITLGEGYVTTVSSVKRCTKSFA